MDVVFVSFYGFACNSAGHIACLANALRELGVRVTVFVPFDKESAARHGHVNFNVRLFDELDAWLEQSKPDAARTIIVAWTPRENVRKMVVRIRLRLECLYVVHLEDNERVITSVNLGCDYDLLEQMPSEELDARIGVDARLSHPHRFPDFVAQASGVSVLMDTLLSFAKDGQPGHVFWPGYNPAFFGELPVNYEGRRSLGIADNELVLAYTGNVHSANRREVLSLYLAVTLLNRLGIKARLVRTGEDYATIADENLAELKSHVIELGKVPSQADVARVTSMADVLVQPGRSDPFNDYRFPSKVPEFFALGRPVLIPATNLGRFVKDGHDCVVLRRGDAFEIAAHLQALHADPALRERLARQSLAYARSHFQWMDIGRGYLTFLRGLVAVESVLS